MTKSLSFGYSYKFDRNGGLVAIHMFDHGYKGTVTWSDGKAVKSVGDDEGFGDDEPDEPSHFEVIFDYRSKGRKMELYSLTNGDKEELVATIYYDDEGRIVRAESQVTTISFKYDKEGRAFNENGEEVYPPMAFFISENPLLPKNHKVLLADDLGRPLKADSHEGHNHYKKPIGIEFYCLGIP